MRRTIGRSRITIGRRVVGGRNRRPRVRGIMIREGELVEEAGEEEVEADNTEVGTGKLELRSRKANG